MVGRQGIEVCWILLRELVEVAAKITSIWVIIVGELKYHLLLLTMVVARQRWKVLNSRIRKRIFWRVYIADVLISCLWPVLLVLPRCHTNAGTDMVILWIDILFVALLIFAENRLSIIDAALICTLRVHMFLQVFLTCALRASKSRRRVEISCSFSILDTTIECKLWIVSV